MKKYVCEACGRRYQSWLAAVSRAREIHPDRNPLDILRESDASIQATLGLLDG